MTRKRFIKLCMSKGISRDGADKVATAGIALGYTYESLLATTDTINKLCALIVKVVPVIIQTIVKGVSEIATCISENLDNSQLL